MAPVGPAGPLETACEEPPTASAGFKGKTTCTGPPPLEKRYYGNALIFRKQKEKLSTGSCSPHGLLPAASRRPILNEAVT